MKHIKRLLLSVLLALSIHSAAHSAEPIFISEHKARAIFIYNLVDYVDWYQIKGDTVTVCLYGQDGTAMHLIRLSQVPLLDKKIKVFLLNRYVDIDRCNMLYISQEKEHTPFYPYLEASNQRKILTISNIEDFTSKGGMMGFSIMRSKVTIDLNRPLLKSTQVRLNPALLHITR